MDDIVPVQSHFLRFAGKKIAYSWFAVSYELGNGKLVKFKILKRTCVEN